MTTRPKGPAWAELPVREGRVFKPPQLAQLAPDRWVLTRRWRCQAARVGLPGVDLPAGMETDGSSIPPAVQWRLGTPMGRALIPGLVHDRRYELVDELGREFADDEYRLNALAVGFSDLEAWALWKGLRLGGSHAWAVCVDLKGRGLVSTDREVLRYHRSAMLLGPWRPG